MTDSQREWTEMHGRGMADVPGRSLWVEDGVVGHYTTLEGGDDPREALADYAATYQGDPGETRVWWRLFEDGKEVDSGTYTFDIT
jgi:hypothetical protein